jgi:hypothetical protein
MASGSPSGSANSSASGTIEAFAQLVKAEGDFNMETAQGKLYSAQADLTEAETGQVQLTNEEYAVRIQRLKFQQLALRTAQRKAEAAEAQIEENLPRVAQMQATGRTNQYIFASLAQVLQILDQPKVILTVMGTAVPKEACDKSNFRYNNEAPDENAPVPDFSGGNVGMLIDFMENNHLQFVKFHAAHMAVLSALVDLSSAAEDRATAIEGDVAKLRDTTPNAIPSLAGKVPGAPSGGSPGGGSPAGGSPSGDATKSGAPSQ